PNRRSDTRPSGRPAVPRVRTVRRGRVRPVWSFPVAITVRTITTEEHVAFIREQPSVSFLQTPAWAKVKSEWRPESLGWFDDSGKQVGVGLVLYRQLPRLKRYLAYLPEGPVIDWESDDIGSW